MQPLHPEQLHQLLHDTCGLACKVKQGHDAAAAIAVLDVHHPSQGTSEAPAPRQYATPSYRRG